MRRAIEAGEIVGPRMHITGPYISGAGASTYMTQVSNPEDARRVVAYWAEEGATWFKAYTRISRAELGAAIEEAHKHGLKFTAHLCSVTFREAVDLGIDSLEHGFFTNTEVPRGQGAGRVPARFPEHPPGHRHRFGRGQRHHLPHGGQRGRAHLDAGRL